MVLKDHPRVCGKYLFNILHFLNRLGSPPRMREVLSLFVVFAVNDGITPAYAGSTEASEECIQEGRDHPRVCGKYCLLDPLRKTELGSPPRMREVLLALLFESRATRITPAYAGSTKLSNLLSLFYRDHPRVCGKYPILYASRTVYQGSPPRMREVLKLFSQTCISSQDHPRVCGKY